MTPQRDLLQAGSQVINYVILGCGPSHVDKVRMVFFYITFLLDVLAMLSFKSTMFTAQQLDTSSELLELTKDDVDGDKATPSPESDSDEGPVMPKTIRPWTPAQHHGLLDALGGRLVPESGLGGGWRRGVSEGRSEAIDFGWYTVSIVRSWLDCALENLSHLVALLWPRFLFHHHHEAKWPQLDVSLLWSSHLLIGPSLFKRKTTRLLSEYAWHVYFHSTFPKLPLSPSAALGHPETHLSRALTYQRRR